MVDGLKVVQRHLKSTSRQLKELTINFWNSLSKTPTLTLLKICGLPKSRSLPGNQLIKMNSSNSVKIMPETSQNPK